MPTSLKPSWALNTTRLERKCLHLNTNAARHPLVLELKSLLELATSTFMSQQIHERTRRILVANDLYNGYLRRMAISRKLSWAA